MAEAVLVDLSFAVKSFLAGHDFGIEFESEVCYADITRTLEDLTGKLHIDTVPWRSQSKLTARGILEYECSVDVIARKSFAEGDLKPGKIDTTAVHRLIKLMQDIDEFFIQSGRALTLASGGWKARLQKTDKKLDYHRPHLYQNQQFTGWNRVTYLAAKEI